MTAPKKASELKPRPPIVVVVGHVDHGKTSLLDYIRKSSVASREAGGITQSIGAYEIEHASTHSTNAQGAPSVRKITFIDTPGHEAFSKMRSRGAEVADLAILVVAAEEGVKPQTREAIAILHETKTPFIVAFTKIDKPEANLEKAMQELTGQEVFLEGRGGQVSYHGVSSKTGEGVSDLLDLIVLATELENFTYDPSATARGYILEAKIDKRRGLEVSGVLRDGTLRTGDVIQTQSAKGKVKILENFLGERAKELCPSSPVLVIGFETLPQVGEEFVVGEGTFKAAVGSSRVAITGTVQSENVVNVMLKAGDAGSLEALQTLVKNIPPTKRALQVLAGDVGDITDNDVKMAIASGAVIAGFKTNVSKPAAQLAEVHGVTILTSDIIYKLIESIEVFLAGPAEGAPIGELEVLMVFNKEQLNKQVVGGKVKEGVIRNRALFDIERGGAVIGSGRITNLQQQKKDANQVSVDNEAGLLVSADIMIAVGDRLLAKK